MSGFTRNVVVFGDSICAGQGVSPHGTWVTRLSGLVEDEFGRRFVLVNSSVNGDTTRLALERMPAAVQAFEPQLVLVQFGMNDCNCWETDRGLPRVSPVAFEHNLVEIVARARAFGATRILLNTNHPTLRHTVLSHAGRSYESGNVSYNTIVRAVASRIDGVTLVDVEQVFQAAAARGARLEDLVLDDLLHLSESGHALYLEIVAPVFLGALRALDEVEPPALSREHATR